MKKYIILLLAVILTSCLNDDFLQRDPLNKQTESTVFTTSENFKTYAWQFYGWFDGYPLEQWFYDTDSDNGFYAATGSENSRTWDKVTIPTNGTNSGWTFDRIRAINILLKNIDGSQMNDRDKKHWQGVGYFFKAWDYFRLMRRFGDVTWVENAIDDSDEAIIYGPRTPRVEIAAKILEMLIYARDNVKENGDGANTVTPSVVNALISRFGLFEGTWQKYHKIANGEPNKYLNASFDASTTLLQKYPNVHTYYDEVFNSKSLAGNVEILLYKNYLPSDNLGHNLLRYCRTSESRYDVCAEAIQSYLCTDGNPIWTSSVYEGDKTTGDAVMNVEFRNRDNRLYFTVTPPYKINTPVANTAWPSTAITYTGNPDDVEYITLMDALTASTASQKQLPILQWAMNIVREVPHFRTNRYNMGQGYNVSESGYYNWKYYLRDTQASANNVGETDAPIFRIGEVMVNHAEAAWELGKFTQTIADMSINVLRKRAKIANMAVANITAGFDPKRDMGGYVPTNGDPTPQAAPDYEVDPVLWEIRRERRVELFSEGFRFDDLRRWRKAHYMNRQQVGAYINKSDYEDSRHVSDPDISKFAMKLDRTGDAGRVVYYDVPTPGWLEKYYLYPLDVNNLVLNPNLTQNPGYKRGN